jgi:hypothetical protein
MLVAFGIWDLLLFSDWFKGLLFNMFVPFLNVLFHLFVLTVTDFSVGFNDLIIS